MLEKIIAYFAHRHLLTNLIVIAVLIGGVFAWNNTGKEELPDITFDRVRISVTYPGAPAADVEFFVTKPLEEQLRGLDGVYRLISTSSVGQSNISVELEQNYPALDEAITEIKNAVLDVDLPDEVIDDPHVRVFKTSKKAILDVALINTNIHLLDNESRRELQQYSYALENQLLNLSAVNSINKKGYLKKEIQIKAYPQKLVDYKIPFNTVMKEIKENHVRNPAGTIETRQEPKVTLISELDTPQKLNDLVIQGGFEGQMIRLNQVADVIETFEKNQSVIKVDGHEAIMLNVVKNSSHGIIEAITAVDTVVNDFRKNSLEGTSIKAVLLDDESIDIRNRLSLIGFNGSLGFILIVLTLFIFLNRRSGIWVAAGIPFTLCFTMICASLMGFTINGVTLAAIIIVMGIIVDDAIVVAENISRSLQKGVPLKEAVVKGTAYVTLPVVASIVTTCVAFVPLYFFAGHFGKFVESIPTIICLVLAASFIESIFILPGHMCLRLPFGRRDKVEPRVSGTESYAHWFDQIENKYAALLEKILPLKWVVLGCFVVLLIVAGGIAKNKMKFVMFPNEETRDITISGSVTPGATRYETAEMVQDIENVVGEYLGKEVVGFRTQIARSRRGGAVEENAFRMIIEIVPKEKRKKSADTLVREFKERTADLQGFERVMFAKSRWGHDSGSAIELLVQQNNNLLREKIVADLITAMKVYEPINNAEVDGDMRLPEYQIAIDQEKTKRLSINAGDVASTFRAALEGTVLYEFTDGDEDVDVRFTTIDAAKDDIEKVLDLPVENTGNYLVPLRDIVTVQKKDMPNTITRRDLKRTTIIDADLKPKTKVTPLEVAEYLEEQVFPDILSRYPTTTLSFGGEIQHTRESTSDFTNAIIMVIMLIYIILAVLFNSLLKPFIIMLAIPFGVVGVIFTFLLHGKLLFGFYACVGALGLAGVVVNDSIVMLVKLEDEFRSAKGREESDKQIAHIAKTRLRAVILTTLTTVAGVLPTAYGFAGYDAMLAEMMLALAWGLVFGTLITLFLVPCVYSILKNAQYKFAFLRQDGHAW